MSFIITIVNDPRLDTRITYVCQQPVHTSCSLLQGKQRIPSNGQIAFSAFMENLKDMEAEPRPESEDRFLNPSRYPSIRAVYQDFLEDYNRHHADNGDPSPAMPMSEDTFRKKFNEQYQEIKIPKTNRFAQCDLCFMFRGKMDLAAGEKKLIYRKQLNLHHADVLKDKAHYYGNR